MQKWLFYWLPTALLLALIAGCAYNHKNFEQTNSPMHGSDDFVLQVDDYGQFWDREQASKAMDRIRALSRETNVIVLTFVHGWNHNAAPDNENLKEFAASLSATRKLLIDPTNPDSAVYRMSRQNLTGKDDLTVVGLYIGWRGRSLPWWFNYTTFWGRKAAAERVGEGDLREFMHELNHVYRDRRTIRAQGVERQFMGLAAIGHSFGAQVLFKAVATDFENELIIASKSLPGSPQREQKQTELFGFGDLVVLVNPAFEAMQFERISRLSEKLSFSPRQSPLLLVVSSAGDIPRQVLFPAGRGLDAIFVRPDFRPGQRALWTEALGEYEPFTTHSIEILPEGAAAPPFDADLYKNNPCAIATFDLSNSLTISRVRLAPTKRHKPNNPFLVAYASTDVVFNHSDVFEEVLRKLLNDYVAITQGKRMLAGDPHLVCR
jgi:hypothetical protein